MTVLGQKNTEKKPLILDFTTVEDLYGEQNLSDTSLFAGGFINFGYWENLNIKNRISKYSRALSSQRLYEKIFNIASINQTDSLLEVGCGLGNGCVLAHQKFKPKYILGIDSSSAQIRRALKRHKNYLKKNQDNLVFNVDKAENLKVPSSSITKAICVEAMQHFESIECFLISILNILESGGKLVVATFFIKSDLDSEFFELFPNFASGIDKLININNFTEMLKNIGYIHIKAQSIGQNVWYGFDKWISQTEYKETWDKNWLTAYKKGILDYYVFEAQKPIVKTRL